MLGGGFFTYLAKTTAHRNTLQKCTRCNVLYNKTTDKCPHCSALNDTELSLQLSKRKATRLSLGKSMFIGAAVIILIMFLLKI